MIDLDDLKKHTDMIELCEALGLEPKGKVARCPAHNDAGEGRPNLAIYPDHVYCFRCGFNADALGLVAKAKGLDFHEAADFLAARLGLAAQGDAGRRRGLGNMARGKPATVYPKPAALPSTPSPTLTTGDADLAGKWPQMAGNDMLSPLPDADQVEGLGYDNRVNGATIYPKTGDARPPLPDDLVADFASFAEAWAYFDQVKTNFAAGLSKDRATGRFRVAAPLPSTSAAADQVDHAGARRPLRVQVFAALLAQGEPASATPAGRWLHQVKGITPATQDRFGIVFLADPRAAAGELIRRFGLDALIRLGIYAQGNPKKGDGRPYFAFKRHRLLFPFYWKGEPVDAQGRDWETDDKAKRFRNTGGANPLPYNADDLVVAKATGKPVFLCEGATDTLALAQSGRQVVGIVGTQGFKSAWLPYFEGLDVYLTLDADEAGQLAARKIAAIFTAAGHRPPKLVKLPAGVKDVNQYFLMERETK